MLREEIEKTKKIVSTDTVSLTVGEVANMYSSGELNILPEFQRLFRWSSDRKSNFVESILVGIPIPPAFAYENEDGTWELIDGLQRISTLLEFMGILKDPESGEEIRSRLVATKYLPSLSGVVWKAKEKDDVALETPIQLFFRRHRIDFQILKHPSEPSTKFDLFQRLNRGGAYATEQEVRTCSMVLANAEITRSIRNFASDPAFRALFKLTDDQIKQQRDVEYAVRLIVHANRNLPAGSDVQEFLDKEIIELISQPNAQQVVRESEQAVRLLFDTLGADALIPVQDRAAGIAGRFSLRALEAIAVGVARNRTLIESLADPAAFLREKVEHFWQQPQVGEMSAAGLRGTVRISRSVPFGEAWFRPNV
ncbi:MAG: DUF262 domain-containing protein [Pseudomonadota bacterium]